MWILLPKGKKFLVDFQGSSFPVFLVIHSFLKHLWLLTIVFAYHTTFLQFCQFESWYVPENGLENSNFHFLMVFYVFCLFSWLSGTFFALARAILLPDLKPDRAPLKLWKAIKVTLCLIFSIIAYCSLGPAIFWSALYKALRTVHDVLDTDQED